MSRISVDPHLLPTHGGAREKARLCEGVAPSCKQRVLRFDFFARGVEYEWGSICSDTLPPARFASAGDEGEGSAQPPFARPPGPQLRAGTWLEPAQVHDGVGIWSVPARLWRCWATTSRETCAFTVRLALGVQSTCN